MHCQNCGQSIVDTARFCSFCGAQQLVDASLHRPSPHEMRGVALPDSANEASDVTVILPRRRTSAPSATPPRSDEGTISASTPTTRVDKAATQRSSITVMKIGGAAAIVIVAAAVAARFYVNPPSPTTHERVEVAPAGGTQAVPAPTPIPIRNNEPDGASANAQAPSTAPMEATSTVKDLSTTGSPSEPPTTQQVPTNRVAAPAKDAVLRKKASPTATSEPAPVETVTPAPVTIAPPAPAPAMAAPAPEPPKAESVACGDISNPFSRELCLWQECAKPEYRSHSECARFSGPGGRR